MRTINSGGSDNASRQPLNNRLAQFLEDSQERLLTIEEVASIYSVTTSAIHKRVQRGHLKSIKDGKRRYFLRSKIFGDLHDRTR